MRQKNLSLDGTSLNTVLAGNTLDAVSELRAELKRRALEGDEEAKGIETYLFGPWEESEDDLL